VSLFTAVVAAAGLAILGLRLRWLTAGGAAAATVVGASVFWRGGAGGAAMLAVFFTSGSLLTRRSARRLRRAQEPRTAAQVLANGAVAAVGALLVPHASDGWLILAGAIAAAQADTWSTEIGSGARAAPRLLTTLAAVPAGTSGGVTLLGTAGGVVGAAVTALVARLAGATGGVAGAALLGGIAGMLGDSALGATLQGRYRCPTCGVATETRRHTCGGRTAHVGGVHWIDNDVVNLLATVAGAATALAWERIG
jgi:uncharacterized protein (TIGR00297 family)